MVEEVSRQTMSRVPDGQEDLLASEDEDPCSTNAPSGKKERSIREYTVGEEIANAATHGIGIILSIIALVLLVGAAEEQGGGIKLIAASIFGGTLILEYTASTLYHAFPWPKVKKLFKIIDHSSIYLLIAGSYTPFTLIVLADHGGAWMTAVIWGIALVGIVVEAFWVFKPRWVNALIYLAMGWIIVLRINVLIEICPPGALFYLVAGGLCYSVGTIFYVLKKVPYMHSIWHLWVVAGSVLHVLAVLWYVI